MWPKKKPVEVRPPRTRKVERVFPADAEIAFYDRDHARVSPWLPANEKYVVDESMDGVEVEYLGIRFGGRDYDHFEQSRWPSTLRKGTEWAFRPPANYVPVGTDRP